MIYKTKEKISSWITDTNCRPVGGKLNLILTSRSEFIFFEIPKNKIILKLHNFVDATKINWLYCLCENKFCYINFNMFKSLLVEIK